MGVVWRRDCIVAFLSKNNTIKPASISSGLAAEYAGDVAAYFFGKFG